MSDINFLIAERFLQALDPGGQFTFQTFGDHLKDPALVRTLNGAFDQHKAELARLNQAGAGVFVTINRTDGRGRKAENITAIRAVFLDLDGAPLPEEWEIEPHFIIESSLERYHVYWLLESGIPLDRFEGIQKALASRYGGDPSVCDLPRVMRLPGFFHQKKEPFLAWILRDWSAEPQYSPKTILSAFTPTPEAKKTIPPRTTDDPVLAKLTEKGMVIRHDREPGKIIIRCPQADQHSNQDPEAAFWLKNHGGFSGYGFKCLHSHCTGLSINDLLRWLGVAEKGPKSLQIATRTLSEVEAKPITWLWPGYFPFGALCLVDGDPGLGKSFFTLDLAARISAGKVFPTGERATPAGVVLMSYEDDPGVTIRPRLETMGADLDRIVLLEGVTDEKGPRLPSIADIAAIRETALSNQAGLIVIDPLMAALPGTVDSHSDHNIRSVLAPLSKLAQETGATVLIVRHLNKSGGGNALYRGGGSIGIVAAARAAFIVGKDPQDETRRVLAVAKLNIAKEPRSLQYRIAVNSEEKPFLSWEGETDLSASDLLTPAEVKHGPSKREQAKKFLIDELSKGPIRQTRLEILAGKMGISESTLDRAKRELAEEDLPIKTERVGGRGGHWVWSLEESVDADPLLRRCMTPFEENATTARTFKGRQGEKEESLTSFDTLPENVVPVGAAENVFKGCQGGERGNDSLENNIEWVEVEE